MYLAICEAENKLKDKEEQVKKLYRSLETRIKTCRDYIELVASGDLTKTLTITGDDDLAMLGVHLNKMTSGLASIAKQIITASTDISVGLNQLEATTSSQATSATQQASSVSEVSAVVGKIRVASAQTLHKAQELGISAEQIYQKGESGKKAVNDIIPSMKTLQKKMGETAGTILNLNDKMKQISEITEVVSDIAKQSKMLALNASIEAAKAGDVGRGFSVVASEIRALSVRSQSSTEDVKKILRDIQKATEQVVIAADEGSELVAENVQEVEKTGGIINALAQVIQESSMASQQIAASIRQESEGIDQVVSSMSEIDQVTQQFSAAAKQTSMASSKLGEVSKALAEQAKKYKV
jgi:methyl-accepting chemotaxis protein